MQTQANTGPAIPATLNVDDELDRLAMLVQARYAQREARSALLTYTNMAKSRQAMLKAKLDAATAHVSNLIRLNSPAAVPQESSTPSAASVRCGTVHTEAQS